MATNLRSLTKKERQLQSSLNGIAEFVEGYRAERDLRQVSVRLQGLEELYKDFRTVRAKIEILLDEEVESTKLAVEKGEEDAEATAAAELAAEEENQRVLRTFEDRYYGLKADLQELLPNAAPTTAPSGDHHSAMQQFAPFSTVKLPEIKLPTFSGKIREWVSFRDTFKSLIDKGKRLSEVDKFTYLKTSLTGEALQEVDSIELSADNYAVAWKMLHDRYENSKLIVKAHLDALFSVEVLRKESYDGLNHLIGEFEKNIQMLEKIGQKPSDWSTILAHMVCSRLDHTTLRHWETHYGSKEVPNYKDLMTFLKNHCSVLQSVAPPKAAPVDQRTSKSSMCHALVKTTNKCPFCSDSWHSPFQCSKFQQMKVEERSEAATKEKLCRNCLRPGHYARFCKGGFCRHCHKRHHSMLHSGQMRSSVPLAQTKTQTPTPQHNQQPKPSISNQQTHSQNNANTANTANSQACNITPATDTCKNTNTSQTCVALPTTPTRNILLSTALVRIKDRHGNVMLARALLDSCSQHCLMTKNFSKRMKFKEVPSYLAVQGIGSSQSVSTKLICAVVVPRTSEISSFSSQMNFHVLPRLTVSLPTTAIDPTGWNLPDAVMLADPNFYDPRPIDIIIGAEYYLELLKGERKKATGNGPTLQNTELGWIVSGCVPENAVSSPQSFVHVCSTAELQDQLTKFWELETCRTNSIHSIEEATCEEIFNKTTAKDERGRFVVTLPKKDHVIQRLGDSKAVAVKRFLGMERRLAANEELRTLYTEFIHKYLAMGHMKEVSEDPIQEIEYFLPHHAVLKPDSTTTKLRVVFDASCSSSTGVSLNDGLMVGPVVQDDLICIALRFRLHLFALVADVAKMYRMIRVVQSDQHLQRIVWRDSPDTPLRIFELSTVTYGTASAPYLATKCLQRLAEEKEKEFPVASKVLKQDFYVDDMLTGVDSIDEGRKLVKDMILLLQSAGFPLRKWNSNCKELLIDIPENLRDERTILELDSSMTTVKTLGLVWEPGSDCFRFSTPKLHSSDVITKQIVVSELARLYDPLGLVNPVVVQAKIFIQELWKQHYDWTAPLDTNFQDWWNEFRRNLAGLEGLKIPRWLGVSTDATSVELHGFCDASEKAYGACIYVRTVTKDGSITVRLLTAKSRVAPLENLKKRNQQQSIPRLELSSALLLAHLYEVVISSLHMNPQSFFWTDSMIVLCWLQSSPSRWKQFVANRVSEVQHITKDGTWGHVAGAENPADIVSRGMIPAQLHYQTLWFNGPNWLLLDHEHWPTTKQIAEKEFDNSALEEKSVTAVLHASNSCEIFGLRASLKKLVRLTALCRRFICNARATDRSTRKVGELQVEDLDEALKVLVQLSQQESFPQELADLSNNRQVRENSKIVRLNPQLINGVICVGGRLQHAAISDSRKHPFIIDGRHPLAERIVYSYHRDLYHAGQQQLIAAVREKFWITNIRNLVRKILHGCVPCYRTKPRVQDQLMADLPPERVTECSPFRRVGVDYCGPFTVAYPQRRCRPIKSYVVIFVCLVTKAVHLDLVADLSTNGFIAALKRFVSRRGKPDLIMCDNATNFVGARRVLDEFNRLFLDEQFQQAVIRDAADDHIEFRFIPARTPNFGGLWESAVRSFKLLFKRTIGTHCPLYDEMRTVLTQIEAILNSRPLTPMSNDPNDFEALTPGHFLIQRPLTAIPEPDRTPVPENRLTAWQKMQQFTQIIWRKWSTLYLSELLNRTKWTRQRNNLQVGTMVLLKEDNMPPLKWPLARVTKVHTGDDGNVRVATLRTKDNGSFTRGIQKICALPIRDNQPLPAGEN